MKFHFLVSSYLILGLALISCNSTSPPSNTQTNNPLSTETKATPTSTSTSTIKPKQLTSTPRIKSTANNTISKANSDIKKISNRGIGAAKLGMTFGQLKRVIGTKAEFQVKSPFMVDFDAIAIIEGGKAQYYILYPAGTKLADSDKIEILLTDNSEYKTDKGIGVGTSLKEAESAYGDATLSYNLAGEGREYVKFANQPNKSLFFRVGSYGDSSLGGIYSSPSGEYNETKQYKDTASISTIEVH